MPPTTKKSDKASVNYRMGGPECGACKYYSEDDDGEDEAGPEEAEYGWCQLVKGRIAEQAQCDLFQRRDGKLE